MKYLYTNNATQEYKGRGREYYKFQAVQTLTGWVGVFKCHEELAKQILQLNPNNVIEVDEEFYNEIIKKKTQNQNRKTIKVSMDPTKPAHAEYREKAVDAEFVEIDEIEVREIEEKKPSKPRKKK